MHVKKVLEILREHKLYAKMTKCSFFQQEMDYLGHVVGINGVKPDLAKIKAIKEWKQPKNVKELRSFLGLAGYYRRFIQDFAKIATPLTNLTQKKTPYKWTASKDAAFE